VTSNTLATNGGHLLRELAPQVLAALARRHSDFAAAEDAVQEALLAASTHWPANGVPDNPRGWLYRVATRRLLDHRRSEGARRRREGTAANELVQAEAPSPAEEDTGAERDDTLRLLFMCCHPALSPATAVALTLRAVAGLTTAEIANAFLLPEATMAQRITRAKQSVKASGAPFEMPGASEQAERLRVVLHVLYLMFSEGYATSLGAQLQRTDLSSEAIRLARTLHALLPDDGEVAGLLALMLLTDARRAARTGPHGELVPLDEQVRSLWDQSLIAEGVVLVSRALSSGSIGAYQLQAAIAAVHDEAARAEQTDWPQILVLYGLLRRMSDNPMVALNHAVAVAMVQGPQAGLELLARLDADARIAGHYRMDAVRAHLWEMAGDAERAIAHYRAAAERTTSLPERNYLTTKAARVAAAHEMPQVGGSGTLAAAAVAPEPR
jgi:RNA polymerase sigma factor (sigma-70 family)